MLVYLYLKSRTLLKAIRHIWLLDGYRLWLKYYTFLTKIGAFPDLPVTSIRWSHCESGRSLYCMTFPLEYDKLMNILPMLSYHQLNKFSLFPGAAREQRGEIYEGGIDECTYSYPKWVITILNRIPYVKRKERNEAEKRFVFKIFNFQFLLLPILLFIFAYFLVIFEVLWSFLRAQQNKKPEIKNVNFSLVLLK